MQAAMVLGKELRTENEIHLDPTGNRKWSEILSQILSIGDLKAHLHSDVLPPTRPYPLQQSHIS